MNFNNNLHQALLCSKHPQRSQILHLKLCLEYISEVIRLDVGWLAISRSVGECENSCPSNSTRPAFFLVRRAAPFTSRSICLAHLTNMLFLLLAVKILHEEEDSS
jgi:hypothetical protein